MRLSPSLALVIPAIAAVVGVSAQPALAKSLAPTVTAAPVVSTTTTAATAVVDPCAVPTDRVVPVATPTQLKAALAAANPGDRISLADGVYGGTSYTLTRSGTALQRIHVCGGPGAVLDFGVTTLGVLFSLKASYVDLVGFTVRNAQKGVVADGASYDLLDRLTVSQIGDEAIHLRTNSHDNKVTNSSVHDTGLRVAGYGEGVYVGSATNNWCTYTACNPDHSDNNLVQGNQFWSTGAEAVDIKEGTVGGTVADNTFDGTGSGALSWVDVKGNNWIIRGNTGHVALRDGFLTEIAAAGWGTNNTFLLNTADVQGPGYGLRVGAGNIVACTNVVTGAVKGYSNVICSK
jgi:hypothetical protein